MKVEIRKNVYCSYDNMKKYLNQQYFELVNKNFYGKTINIVCFPTDIRTVTSTNVKKVMKKFNDNDVITLYFAHCFTIDAINLINEKNDAACAVIEFPWTDESYKQIRGDPPLQCEP